MTVKVIRMTLEDYNKLSRSWGHKVHQMSFEVPSTIDGIKFKGLFLTDRKDEVAVAWPVDRPAFAQDEYSQTYRCGFPVDAFEIRDSMNGKGH